MFDLLGKITESIQASFNFLNRHNSPSTKVVFHGPVSFPTGDLGNTKAKEAASDLWESVVSNMKEAPFVIEQGINRHWLSEQMWNTHTKFEKYRIHFSPEFNKAFENWYYAFQSAFRSKDLYETNIKKEAFESEIRKIISPKSDYIAKQKEQMDENERRSYLNSTK